MLSALSSGQNKFSFDFLEANPSNTLDDRGGILHGMLGACWLSQCTVGSLTKIHNFYAYSLQNRNEQ